MLAYAAAMDNGWDRRIDAVGLLCPLPVLRAARELRAMAPGEVLCIEASDPAAWVDMPHYCTESGHLLLEAQDMGGTLRFLIRREG